MAASLDFGPVDIFPGSPCEFLGFSDSFVASCDGNNACGSATCLEIDQNSVDATACSGSDFSIFVGIDDSTLGDVDIFYSDNFGNTFGPFNEFSFNTDAGDQLLNYNNPTCAPIDLEFTFWGCRYHYSTTWPTNC